MIAYGFPGRAVEDDLAIARRIGASVVEALPDWRAFPDPAALAAAASAEGLSVHSAHGCWGGQSIAAGRVDLGALDPSVHAESVDDVKRCVDWLAAAGGQCLVVHPGGLSDLSDRAARRARLMEGLGRLADHSRGTGVVLCVENMPPGVHPGSRALELADLVDELGRAEVALALDTGHAHISADLVGETLACGARLATTHVHDNDGRQDVHDPPGLGSIDWASWPPALDVIGYDGPVMLECIRRLRSNPDAINGDLLQLLDRLTRRGD
jgi:sugar phosphate isomerase/epimerase